MPIELLSVSDAKVDEALVDDATTLLGDLVSGGAAIGWTRPPPRTEVAAVLRGVASRAAVNDASLIIALATKHLAGLGYWERYERQTHRPNADLVKMAVAREHQGRGYGRLLLERLVESAKDAGIEQLTLDLRDDNFAAMSLYSSCGFREYGRLERFVAVGDLRYGKVFMVKTIAAAS